MTHPDPTEGRDNVDDLREDVLGSRLIKAGVLFNAFEEIARSASLHGSRTRWRELLRRWRSIFKCGGSQWRDGQSRNRGRDRDCSCFLRRALPRRSMMFHDLQPQGQHYSRHRDQNLTHKVEVSLVFKQIDERNDTVVSHTPEHECFERNVAIAFSWR